MILLKEEENLWVENRKDILCIKEDYNEMEHIMVNNCIGPRSEAQRFILPD